MKKVTYLRCGQKRRRPVRRGIIFSATFLKNEAVEEGRKEGVIAMAVPSGEVLALAIILAERPTAAPIQDSSSATKGLDGRRLIEGS